jgi:hypothetical protein
MKRGPKGNFNSHKTSILSSVDLYVPLVAPSCQDNQDERCDPPDGLSLHGGTQRLRSTSENLSHEESEASLVSIEKTSGEGSPQVPIKIVISPSNLIIDRISKNKMLF